MVTRKICVVTGTRAEYGLLRFLMEEIRSAEQFELQLVVAGMHLSPEFGLTYREIETDGFSINRKVEMLLSSDTAVGTAKAVGLGMIGFADVFSDLRPDIIVLLGDRFEALAAATAALFAGIPIAHLHGGEATEGAFDESIRHAITKMSHLHFVATEEYRQRVIQLGEDPRHVFLTGGLGVDAIKRTSLMDREQLEQSLQFHFGKRNLLITWHPVTLDNFSAKAQFEELLNVLHEMSDVHCIFTKPNADPGSRGLVKLIDEFTEQNGHRSKAFVSLGQKRYWSVMSQVDAVVGNSSSGLLEAPTFHVGTINIGDRQRGRVMAKSIIQSEPKATEIRSALDYLYSKDFQDVLVHVTNPYGDGGAVDKIVGELSNVEIDVSLLKKVFNDISSDSGQMKADS